MTKDLRMLVLWTRRLMTDLSTLSPLSQIYHSGQVMYAVMFTLKMMLYLKRAMGKCRCGIVKLNFEQIWTYETVILTFTAEITYMTASKTKH